MFLSSKFFPNFFPNEKSSDSNKNNEDKKHKNNVEKITEK